MSNVDPRTRYLSTKYFKNTRKVMGSSLENILIFIPENLRFWKCWKVCVPSVFFIYTYIYILCFCNFEILKFEKVKNWNLETWTIYNLEIWKFPNWKFPNWKCPDWKLTNCKCPQMNVFKLTISNLTVSKLKILKWANPQHPSTVRLPPVHPTTFLGENELRGIVVIVWFLYCFWETESRRCLCCVCYVAVWMVS